MAAETHTNPPAHNAKKSMASSSIYWWYILWQVVTVIALAVTFIAGFGTVVTGKWLNDKQSDEMAALKQSATRLDIAAKDSLAAQQRVEVELAEAKTKQAEAEKATLELQIRLSSRKLSPEQRQLLIDSLSSYKGQRLGVVEYGLSREAASFSKEIETALTEAGWTTKQDGMMNGVEQEPGVIIFISKGQDTIPAADALTKCLKQMGFAARYMRDDGGFLPVSLEKGVVGMFVGQKPDVLK